MTVIENKFEYLGVAKHMAFGLFAALVQFSGMTVQAAADLRPAEMVDRFGTAFDSGLPALRTGDTTHLGAALENPPRGSLGNVQLQWYSVGSENAVVVGLYESLNRDGSYTHCTIRSVSSPDTIARLALRGWANQMESSLETQPGVQVAEVGSGQTYSWCENDTRAIEVSFGDSQPGLPLIVWITTGGAATSNPCREE